MLSLDQRKELTECMLGDVLSAIKASEYVDCCIVISSDKQVLRSAKSLGVEIILEANERGVNLAISRANGFVRRLNSLCSVVFPSDIPLITPYDVDGIVSAGRSSNSIVISPSMRLDGTNALLRKPPDLIPTYFDLDSFNSHLQEAQRRGLQVKLVLSRGVMLDIDTPGDVNEFLSTSSETATYDFLHRILEKRSGKVSL
jgi:2-phospho-L-lactate guanylyltransferase